MAGLSVLVTDTQAEGLKQNHINLALVPFSLSDSFQGSVGTAAGNQSTVVVCHTVQNGPPILPGWLPEISFRFSETSFLRSRIF